MLKPAQPIHPSQVSRRYLLYVLMVIIVANILNYLDRMVVSGLEHELSSHLGLSVREKWKYGLLWTAFTVGYMFTSPFLGFLADRLRRTWLFALCVLVWSLATIGCGLTGNYWVFLLMRVIIGVGEAGCLVIGPTILADYFPSQLRGRVLSALFLGMPIGGALGYITAGQVHWEWAFFVAGLPGIPVAVALFLLHEPQRGGSEATPELAHPQASLRSYVQLLKIRTLLYIILAQAFAAFTLVPLMHYGIGYFESLGVSKALITTRLGALVVFGGILGSCIGGLLGDWLGKRDRGAYALLAGIGFLVAFPATVVGLHLVPGAASYPVLLLSFSMFFMCMPLVNTQIANVVPASQRASAFAASVFVLHILGDTLSPPLFGYISGSIREQMHQNGDLFTFTFFSMSLLFSSFFCYLAWRNAGNDSTTPNVVKTPEKLDELNVKS